MKLTKYQHKAKKFKNSNKAWLWGLNNNIDPVFEIVVLTAYDRVVLLDRNTDLFVSK